MFDVLHSHGRTVAGTFATGFAEVPTPRRPLDNDADVQALCLYLSNNGRVDLADEILEDYVTFGRVGTTIH